MRTRSVDVLMMAALAASAISPGLATGQAVGPEANRPRVRLPDVAKPPDRMTVVGGRALPGPKPKYVNLPESIEVGLIGTVRDLDDRPVEGATVYAIGTRIVSRPRTEFETAVIATATTGKDGSYRFPGAKAPVSHDPGSDHAATPYVRVMVASRAPGSGLGWHEWMSMYADEVVDPDDIQGRQSMGSAMVMDVHLRPAAELRGRVVDEAGRPYPGVKVEMPSLCLLDEEGRETTVSLNLRSGVLPPEIDRAETDADGRFRLSGLPTEACCWLFLEPSGTKARLALYASTSSTVPTVHPQPPPERRNGRGRHEVYPADFTVTIPRPRRLDVRVVAADDGKPVPGLSVDSLGDSLDTGLGSGGLTDGEGRATLDLPPGRHRGLSIDPMMGTGSRFIRTELGPLVVTAGPAPQVVEVRMRPGCEVLLEVVDPATGKGIPDLTFEVEEPATVPEGGPGTTRWSPLVNASPSGWPVKTDATGKARGLIEPSPGGPRRVRISGTGPDVDRSRPPAPPMKGWPTFGVIGEISRPFDPGPGASSRIRFEVEP